MRARLFASVIALAAGTAAVIIVLLVLRRVLA
jgi:hypothetical protein